MKTYEYNTFTIPPYLHISSVPQKARDKELLTYLNQIGSEGWKLVQIVGDKFYFMREVIKSDPVNEIVKVLQVTPSEVPENMWLFSVNLHTDPRTNGLYAGIQAQNVRDYLDVTFPSVYAEANRYTIECREAVVSKGDTRLVTICL